VLQAPRGRVPAGGIARDNGHSNRPRPRIGGNIERGAVYHKEHDIMNTTQPATPAPDGLAQAGAIVEGIDSLLQRALAAVKRSLDGDFSSASLDRHQLVSYELAMLSAEVHAARTMLDYALQCGADGKEASFECALVSCAVADFSTRARSRLDKIKYAVELDEAALTAVFSSAPTHAFLRAWLDPDTIAETGHQALEQLGFGQSQLDEDKEIIAASFARFADEVVAPLAEKIHRHDLTVPEEILAPLREMGCFGLSVPERYGGTSPDSGEDHLAMVVVTEELSRASLAAAGSLITRPEIMAKAIYHGGTEAQREAWLPKIANGDPLCGIAITEPDAGSDVAAMRFKAARTDGGWLLNGAKTWSTFAGKSGILLVLARTDPDPGLGHRGLSLFIVEKTSTEEKEFSLSQAQGGRLSGAAIPTIGYRGMHSFTLFFDDWFVPDANLIGGEDALGKGFYLTMKAFAGGRLQTAARANGLMRAAFAEAMRYAKARRVFGQALSGYQLTLVKIAQMAWNLRACHEMTYNVARLMDGGGGHIEASLVKLYACRAAEAVTREAVQIHGGMGYSEETPVSRYYVDARVLSIFEGAEETLALKVVAKELITNADTTLD
jgi:(2S)-methylsuccinyl-CoA dehydrogenase